MRYRFGDPSYGLADLVNLTGTPGNDQRTNQGAPASAPAPGHKAQVEVDAQTSRRQDSYTAQLLVHAAHAEEQAHYDRQRDPRAAAYLAHVIGSRARA